MAEDLKYLDTNKDNKISGAELIADKKENPHAANGTEINKIIKDPDGFSELVAPILAEQGLTLEKGAMGEYRTAVLNGSVPLKPSGNSR